MGREKEIRWLGSAYDDLLEFPDDARRRAGFQLGKVQAELEPDDWKPFDDVGPGTREIRIRETSGAYRVMYVAKFEEVVYVPHCFQKKTRQAVGTGRSPRPAIEPWSTCERSGNEDRNRNPPRDETGGEHLPGVGVLPGGGKTSARGFAQAGQ